MVQKKVMQSMESEYTERQKDRKTRMKQALPAVTALAVLDQMTKMWAVGFLRENGPVVLWENVLELLYVENRGAAFGILQNQQWFFMVITVIILAVVLRALSRIPGTRRYLPLRLCGYFIIAGAAGNMIDRCFRHYVVDFIYFKLIDFPVFNVADIYVTVSAFSLAALILFYYQGSEIDVVLSGRREKK